MNAVFLLVVRHALGGMALVSLIWSCMMMRKITSVATLLFLITYGVEAATIANVKAQQRPKSDIVDVYYDLVESGGGVFDISISIEGGGDKPTLSTLSGAGESGGEVVHSEPSWQRKMEPRA